MNTAPAAPWEWVLVVAVVIAAVVVLAGVAVGRWGR